MLKASFSLRQCPLATYTVRFTVLYFTLGPPVLKVWHSLTITPPTSNFRLSYYPHRVERFGSLLQETFGEGSTHTVYGDFRPLGEVADPAFYIHVVEKPA